MVAADVCSSCPASAFPQRLEDTVELTVRNMGGAEIAVLLCAPGDTLSEVKDRLSRVRGDLRISHHQLISGRSVLEDYDTLPCTKALTVYCVQITPSRLAAFLHEHGGGEGEVMPFNAYASEEIDTVLQFQHQQSERRRPATDAVLEAAPVVLRAKLVSWLTAAFDALCFGHDLLCGTVLTFDRYCAAVAKPIDAPSLGVALLAAICTEMKVESGDDFPPGHWQRLLQHLCQGRCELPVILRAEHSLLRTLDYATGTPHAFSFFTGLAARLRAGDLAAQSESWLELGVFLLTVALLDPTTQYARPHAILAAAAISGGLSVLEAPAVHRDVLLEDLGAYLLASPASSTYEEAVNACEEELLSLWERLASGDDALSQHYASVEAMFSTPKHFRVAQKTPRRRLAELRAMARATPAAA